MNEVSKSVANKKTDGTTTKKTKQSNAKSDKKDRLSEQLRANLQRRKKRASSSS